MEEFEHGIFFDDRFADFGCNLVVLWMGEIEDPLQFEVVWPHYDDSSRSQIDQAKAKFLEYENHPRQAATPEMTLSFCMSSIERALLGQ